MQFTIKSFRQLFPDKIFFPDNVLIFSKIPDISLTAVKFPDIFPSFPDTRSPWMKAKNKQSAAVHNRMHCSKQELQTVPIQMNKSFTISMYSWCLCLCHVQHEHKHQLTKLHCSVSEISLSKEKKYSVAYLGFQKGGGGETPRWVGCGGGVWGEKNSFLRP